MYSVEKFLYSRKEAALSLGISVRSLDYIVARKELPTRRIGGKVLIPAAALKKFAAADHYGRICDSEDREAA